jgi:hypothetical protein
MFETAPTSKGGFKMIDKKKKRGLTSEHNEFDRATSMIAMLDYLITEAQLSALEAEYFLRLARTSLLESEQKIADTQRRH